VVRVVRVLQGLVIGAAGTTALNAVTYADMAVRGRQASATPERTVVTAARALGFPLPGDAEQDPRVTGAAALLGLGAGTSAGVLLTVVRGDRRGLAADVGTAWALAMVVGNGPMTLLGVTDPRSWSSRDWIADVVPHLAYACAAGLTRRMLHR